MQTRDLRIGDRVFVRKPYHGGAGYAYVRSLTPLRVEWEQGSRLIPYDGYIPVRWIVRKADV